LIDFKIYNTVADFPNSWDALPNHDVFLKQPFLRALEDSCPKNITPYYVGVFKADKLVGIAIIQRVELYFDDVFRKEYTNSFKRFAKGIVAKVIRGNLLVVGNLMHTGQHSLFFLVEDITYNEYLNTVYKALIRLKLDIKNKHNKKIRLIAFKDYFELDTIHDNISFFNDNGLYKVQVQPNMLLPIQNSWSTLDDYILAFTKKYKKRYNTARRKSKAVNKLELSIEEVRQNEKKLFELYKNVSDSAGVNSFVLNEHHFLKLKEELKEYFKVIGYFLNGELIGFYTLILNEEDLETYFLGYHPKYQYKHQLYLNMLYDMAGFAVENKYKTVVYARTAMEIKSSVGAEAHRMHIYMKHTNNFISNTILKLVVKYMNPTRKWVKRNPFK